MSELHDDGSAGRHSSSSSNDNNNNDRHLQHLETPAAVALLPKDLLMEMQQWRNLTNSWADGWDDLGIWCV